MKTLNFNCPPFLSSHFFQRYKIPIVSAIFKIWFQSKWKDKVTGSYKWWIVPVERDNCAGMAINYYYYYNDLNNSNSVHFWQMVWLGLLKIWDKLMLHSMINVKENYKHAAQKSSAPNADCKTWNSDSYCSLSVHKKNILSTFWLTFVLYTYLRM